MNVFASPSYLPKDEYTLLVVTNAGPDYCEEINFSQLQKEVHVLMVFANFESKETDDIWMFKVPEDTYFS